MWGAVCSPFSLFAQKSKKQSHTLSQRDSLKLNDLFVSATESYLNQNYNKAIQQYNKVKLGYPNDDAVYHQISKCYASLKEYNKAIQYGDIAIELNPTNKYYYLHLSSLLREIKAWKQLAVCYEALLKNCKGVNNYKYDLAQIYFYYSYTLVRSNSLFW